VPRKPAEQQRNYLNGKHSLRATSKMRSGKAQTPGVNILNRLSPFQRAGPISRDMPSSRTVKLLFLALFSGLWVVSSGAEDDLLWYQQPAKDPMAEALPIGNGRLGGLVFGLPEKERLCLNEDSLWTGAEN